MQTTQLQNEEYTDSQLDWLMDEERSWRESQPVLSYYQLLDIYGPGCYGAARHGLIARIARCKEDLKKAQEMREWWHKNIINKAVWKDKWFWKMICEKVYVAQFEEGREASIKKSYFLLSFIKRQTAKQKGEILPTVGTEKITDADVAQAKEVPIESLYSGKLHKQGGRATGVCPFHNEKTGSFTIYLKQNKFYCYSCSAGADVIDFVMKQQGVDFLTAVKVLLHRV